MKGTWYAKISVDIVGLTEKDFDPDDLLRIEKDHHITVSKLIPESRIGAIVDKSRKLGCFDVVLTDVFLFENTDCDILHIKVEGDYLEILHKQMQTECGVGWPHESFNPHVTLAYLKPGTGRKYLNTIRHLRQKIRIRNIQFKLFRCKSTVTVDLS